MRKTCHPAALRASSARRSRATLPSSFSRHHSRLLAGQDWWIGQTCQKHPSTKTATFARLKTRSALARIFGSGRRSTRYRKPRRWISDLSASSGFVSRRLRRLIRSETAGELGCGGGITILHRGYEALWVDAGQPKGSPRGCEVRREHHTSGGGPLRHSNRVGFKTPTRLSLTAGPAPRRRLDRPALAVRPHRQEDREEGL